MEVQKEVQEVGHQHLHEACWDEVQEAGLEEVHGVGLEDL